MREYNGRWAIWLGVAVAVGIVAALLALLAPAVASSREVDARVSAGGWQTVFIETFGRELGAAWRVTDVSDLDGGEYQWGLDTFTATSPITSAWCMGGAERVDGSYTDNMDTWLIYGPLTLTDELDAYVQFDWWLDTGGATRGKGETLVSQAIDEVTSAPETGDWLGWCVLGEENGLDDASCTYVSSSAGQWSKGSIDLSGRLPSESGGSETIWIAFRFISDGDGMTGRGAFVDDLELRVKRGSRVMLPVIRKGPSVETANLLQNAGFEADWSEEESHRCLIFISDEVAHETEVGNIFTPPGWLTWFRHEPGTWDQPEVQDAWVHHDPRRVRSGEKAQKLFTFYRKHDAGFLQQIEVKPGTEVRFTAWAHAWSNHPIAGHEACAGDPRCSSGVGWGPAFLLEEDTPPLTGDPWNDAIGNFSFMVGIDPTGGTNPYAATVVWGPPAHIYNEHHQVPAVEATAESEVITVFLRSKTLWPFKHNDAYWDDAELVATGESPVPTPGPTPQPVEWDYPVIEEGSKIGVHAIHPDGVGSFADELADAGTRFPVVKVADDLGWLPAFKDSSPETITIGRVTSEIEAAQNVADPQTDLDEMANALLSFVLNRITVDPRLRDAVDYWEVVNEPDPPGPEGYRRLAELMIICMEKAETHDLKLALFSLNAGTPEWDEMEAMVETGVFARAREAGHILALHEGTFSSHDPMQWWGFPIPGSPVVEGAGPLNFRYRFLYHLLGQRGEAVPLVVSEWYCGDEQSASTQTLVDALKWYEGEASQDYYFWATCPFTLGPTSQWQHTDYERVYDGGLVDYIIQVKDRQNVLPPGRSWWEDLLRRLDSR